MSLYWNALTVHTNYLQYLWDNIYLNGNSTEACLRLHVKLNQLERVSSLILWNWIQECFIWKTDKVLIPDIEIHCSNSSKKMKKNVPCEVLLLILEDHHHRVGYNWLLRGRKFYFVLCVLLVSSNTLWSIEQQHLRKHTFGVCLLVGVLIPCVHSWLGETIYGWWLLYLEVICTSLSCLAECAFFFLNVTDVTMEKIPD